MLFFKVFLLFIAATFEFIKGVENEKMKKKRTEKVKEEFCEYDLLRSYNILYVMWCYF